MRRIFLFLTLGTIMLAFAVFVIPIYVGVQLNFNRERTFILVRFGIIGGLLWFTVYRFDDAIRQGSGIQPRFAAGLLESFIKHPENILKICNNFIDNATQSKSRQNQVKDLNNKATSVQKRLFRAAARLIYEKGLDIFHFNARLYFGTGDAAGTAVGVGIIHTLIGVIMAVSQKQVRFLRERPRITIIPRYNEVCINLMLDGTFRLWPADIIFSWIFGKG
ncbi:MAG: DUF2953 domain-containing protein [Firmicutes bacterium]|jgi:hypothetical protein|nr:DUF2953 domain-containing protein [Bacillota bacterium]